MLKNKYLVIGLCVVALISWTISHLTSIPDDLNKLTMDNASTRYFDRNGIVLTKSYQRKLNGHNLVTYSNIPNFLIDALIISEDKRYFSHNGIDWLARLNAFKQNLTAKRIIRGASTITEQVIRIINPRKRTLTTKWLETWEAYLINHKFDKITLLEFYLNQVPFAANRRGIVEAAEFYFGHSLDTLNKKEMLALAIMIRAPSLFNPKEEIKYLNKRIPTLLKRMIESKKLSKKEAEAIAKQNIFLIKFNNLDVDASHFIRYVSKNYHIKNKTITTTLDAELQNKIQPLADSYLQDIKQYNARNCGVLVADISNGEILSWVIGQYDEKTSYIDTITTPRQPGSTLKPFVYALAIDKGWTDKTKINDAPITEAVNSGIHTYSNFNDNYYDEVTLRQALGNSLNTPAIRTLKYVGLDNFIDTLKKLGFSTINQPNSFYGNGIVLGNVEVTLLELVEAYTALALDGTPIKLAFSKDLYKNFSPKKVFSKKASDTIKSILADPLARGLEFGINSILNFETATAIKTGTSSSSRDVWAVAFNSKYIVGVWLGNLNAKYTKNLTGASGAVQLLKSVFNEINKKYGYYGIPNVSLNYNKTISPLPSQSLRIIVPNYDMEVFYDPKISKEHQKLAFKIEGLKKDDKVIWFIDNKEFTSNNNDFLWSLEKGSHHAYAKIIRENQEIKLPERNFVVK